MEVGGGKESEECDFFSRCQKRNNSIRAPRNRIPRVNESNEHIPCVYESITDLGK